MMSLAACGKGDAGPPVEVCAEAEDPQPWPSEVVYIRESDPEHGCEDADPTRSTDVICVNGDPITKHCCGDIGWPLFCRCGSWICPQGTILISECKTSCDPFGGAQVDGGT